MTDWEEIKKLAADFQRAQLSTGVQRLSEQNCIEIINKLIEKRQLEVVFTTDGTEYVTPQHLIREIKDELFVHHGRINLVELAKILCVDLSVVSAKATEIQKFSTSFSLVNGQLINSLYINVICEEINDKLKLKGQVTLSELASQFDLPSNFLLSIIEKQLGKIIKAQQDVHNSHVFFTDDFKKRNVSLVKGALLAFTRPIPVTAILSLCNLEEVFFYSIINYLSENKEIPGSITGREGTNSTYIPFIYLNSQLKWVKTFFDQNGYLDFNALSSLGISNPTAFIKKHFSDSNLFVMKSCAVGQIILDQVEGAIEDTILSSSFVNILPLLPSFMSEKDVELIISQILKNKPNHNLHIFDSIFVVTDKYLKNLLLNFNDEVEKRAKECVFSGTYLKHILSLEKINSRNVHSEEKFESRGDKKEERKRKAAEGKIGGGTHGRETKTKSTKKKFVKNLENDSADDYDEKKKKICDKDSISEKLEILNMDDIKMILNKDELLQEENSEELIDAIACFLFPKLHKNALEACRNIYEATLSASNLDRRKKHNELEDKLNGLVTKVKLFEKGIKQFSSAEVQQQLSKYLLKSICTDIVNEIFAYVCDNNEKVDGRELTNELRIKMLASIPINAKDTLIVLNKSLTSSSINDFLNVIDEAVGSGLCDIRLKKLDKKKERAQLIEQRQQLIYQLNVAEDFALILHLSCLIIFQEVTQTMLHASGKFVSTILKYLQADLPVEKYNTLQKYHDLVLKALTTSDVDEKSKVEKLMLEETQIIKDITITFKKNMDQESI